MLHSLLAPLLAALAAPGALEGPATRSAPLEAVPFELLAAAPERFLGETVATVFVVRSAVAAPWSGYLSGVAPSTHVALDVWADAQPLWEEEEYAAPLGRVYVALSTLFRETAPLGRHLGAPRTFAPFTRLAATVRVEAYTAGRGFIVVTDVARTPEQAPEGTVLHAIRGRELLGKGAYALAVSELEKALLPDVPAHVRAALERDLNEARARASRAPSSKPARRSPPDARGPRGSGASGPRG